MREGVRRSVYVIAEPWPGLPIRKGNRRQKAADMADGTWPDLVGKFKPHDNRHTHATWLENSDVTRVLQMDRRGHAMNGMDATYFHVSDEMRQHLCDFLQRLWNTAVAKRDALASRSAVPLLEMVLLAHENGLKPRRRTAAARRQPTQASGVPSPARGQAPRRGQPRVDLARPRWPRCRSCPSRAK